GTVLMALLTNFPLALAPGMGINAYFAFTICLGLGVPWQSALGLVFINGVLFLILSVTGMRQRIIEALPYSLKIAITAGIGLFIAFIGFQNGGLIVADPVTLVRMGNLTQPSTALFFGGLLLTCVLMARKIPGAIILSMAITALAGLFIPNGHGGTITQIPKSLFSLPASLDPVFFKLNFDYVIREQWKALPVILTLLLVGVFDNLGTLIGVTRRTHIVDKDGNIPKIERALVADSLAAMFGAVLGTSPVVSYIESASGVAAGGRTGLTAMTTAACFLVALLLTPLILAIPAVAVAPALVIVGILMFEAVADLDFSKLEDAVPAILTIITLPLCFSISTGIGIGLIALCVLAIGTGNFRKLSVINILLAIFFALHFLDPLLRK
ncbi:MAG: NCS2 family permease, partial [Chthoniobacterales bacterium]